MNPSFLRISEIPLPDGLTPIQALEYSIFQGAITEVEEDVARFRSRENVDRELVKVVRQQRAHADNIRRLRLDVVNQELEAEKEAVQAAYESAKMRLYKRLVETLRDADASVMEELKVRLGDEFDAYAEATMIKFPVSDEPENPRMLKPVTDSPVTIPSDEVKKDRERIMAAAEGEKA